MPLNWRSLRKSKWIVCGLSGFLAALGLAASGCASQKTAPPFSSTPVTLESLSRQLESMESRQSELAARLEALEHRPPTSGDFHPVLPLHDHPAVITLNVHGEPFRGSDSARFAIIEYSDFNCSFCARYVTNIYPALERDYIRTGKVRYLFHDLPDRLDPDSLEKARVARCAGLQGKFWEMHDRLFARPLPVLDHPEVLEEHALVVGLDAIQLKSCLQNPRLTPFIERIAADARGYGIEGTPAFLVGRLSETGDAVWATKVIVGAESYEALKQELDEVVRPDPAKVLMDRK